MAVTTPGPGENPAKPIDKPINPVELGDWVNTLSKPIRDLAKGAVRDNKAIRDYKGNIIAIADSQDTSTSFTWKDSTATPAAPAPAPAAPAPVVPAP